MPPNEDENRIVADTVARRVRVGEDPVVAGWQQMLSGIFTKMRPYLIASRLVTFQQLMPAEKAFFTTLYEAVKVPGHVLALFMPPSVRHQMMFANHGEGARIASDHDPERPLDAGVVLAAADGLAVILNALFAYPPSMPAVDVYEGGRLIAGYSYRSIEECIQSLTELMRTYL